MDLKKSISFLILSGFLGMLLFLLNVFTGSVNIPVQDALTILFTGSHPQETWTNIIWNFRLPKALTAVLAGSALALSGLQMQTLFRNSLAGPFVLGISSGASLGVAMVILGTGTLTFSLPFISSLGIAGAAILGSSLVMVFILFASGKVAHNMTILILGLMLGYLTNAVVSFLVYFSEIENLQVYVLWTLGNFNTTGWNELKIMFAVLILGFVFTLSISKSLDALLLGDNYAHSMGVNVKKCRTLIILSTSLLAGTVTAYCGPIAFLGLAVPHLCRGLIHSTNHRYLIPAVCLLGGGLALFSDLIAQLPGSQKVLPLNE